MDTLIDINNNNSNNNNQIARQKQQNTCRRISRWRGATCQVFKQHIFIESHLSRIQSNEILFDYIVFLFHFISMNENTKKDYWKRNKKNWMWQ